MVLARPDERETRPYHFSLRLSMMIRSSSYSPIACWILARTSSLVTWSLYVYEVGTDFLVGNMVFVCIRSWWMLIDVTSINWLLRLQRLEVMLQRHNQLCGDTAASAYFCSDSWLFATATEQTWGFDRRSQSLLQLLRLLQLKKKKKVALLSL